MNFAVAVALGAAGNLFIADLYNNRIRKIWTSGTITTVAGNGAQNSQSGQGTYSGDNGPATSAGLNIPYGAAVDTSGNLLIADLYNNRVRKVSSSGTITTVAGNGQQNFSGDGGPATSAITGQPYGLAVDAVGNLFVADFGNDRVRKVSSSGVITTIAGNGNPGFSGDGGTAASAQLNYPKGLAVDAPGPRQQHAGRAAPRPGSQIWGVGGFLSEELLQAAVPRAEDSRGQRARSEAFAKGVRKHQTCGTDC
ncbi:MAG: hypothetical protein ABSH56_32365 [Bryobacteraceae bacterium]